MTNPHSWLLSHPSCHSDNLSQVVEDDLGELPRRVELDVQIDWKAGADGGWKGRGW